MSHDLDLIDTTHSGQHVTVYSQNWTHNFDPALNAVGLNWSDFDGRTAYEIAPVVAAAYSRLIGTPERYRHLIRGGGHSTDSGTLERLLENLAEFYSACTTHFAAQFNRL